MYFTIIFLNGPEGPSLSYDLLFHPCPVWYQGNTEIGVPNINSPVNSLGFFRFLINQIKPEEIITLKDGMKLHTRFTPQPIVKVITHDGGHGSENDLAILLEDITNEGFQPILLK